eukprot:TRINITY_DN22828_c1_g1_i2.p1 TRINITY_DN22828_c1_g1~~TRINITY_DN22828_c1_g1_i2.p1  ORF type:complete len:381 (-),score=58.66 TRINITY_DN22828_c1_g1_i2:206-1348(-)
MTLYVACRSCFPATVALICFWQAVPAARKRVHTSEEVKAPESQNQTAPKVVVIRGDTTFEGNLEKCPQGFYCVPYTLGFWESVGSLFRFSEYCDGTCVPCHLDAEAPVARGEAIKKTPNRNDHCASCSFSLNVNTGKFKDDPPKAGAVCEKCPEDDDKMGIFYTLLKDIRERPRCYRRPEPVKSELPGLCNAAIQAEPNEEVLPNAADQMWMIREASSDQPEAAKVPAEGFASPVRLQPFNGKCGVEPCQVYLATFDEPNSVLDEARARWAGASSYARQNYAFTLRPGQDLIGETGIFREVVDEAAAARGFTVLSFNVPVADFYDEPIPGASQTRFEVRPTALTALRACHHFIQTGERLAITGGTGAPSHPVKVYALRAK